MYRISDLTPGITFLNEAEYTPNTNNQQKYPESQQTSI